MAQPPKANKTKKTAKAAPKKTEAAAGASAKKKFPTVAGHTRRARPKLTPFFAQSQVPHKWFVVDLENQVIGRAASIISGVLRGKNKVTFTPHDDCGDFVVAINAAKARFSGKKWQDKVYHHYTGWRGGLKETTAEKLFQKSPETVLLLAVKGMLPKSPLGRHLLTKFKVYAGSEHPHAAQKPETLSLGQSK